MKAWRNAMLQEYNGMVQGLSEEEKDGLRKEWEDPLKAVLDDEAVAMLPATHLSKAWKHMLQAVRIV